MVKKTMTEEYITLKEFVQELKKSYKYVRLIELKDSMEFRNRLERFDKMILVSNELEEYTDSQIEMDNIKILIKTCNVELLLFMFIPVLNIPLFQLNKKIEQKLDLNIAMYSDIRFDNATERTNLVRYHDSLVWETSPIEDWDDHIPKIKIFQKIDDWITKHIPVILFGYYLTIKFKYLRWFFEITYNLKGLKNDKQ